MEVADPTCGPVFLADVLDNFWLFWGILVLLNLLDHFLD